MTLRVHTALLLLLAGAVPAVALASGARQAVKARHGEMVILRDVSARHAYRTQPPGMAVIVDPSPRRELGQALGTSTGMEELDEGDYAGLEAGMAQREVAATTVSQVTHQALSVGLGRSLGREGVLSGQRLGGSIGASMGMVGRTTGGIAGQINDALGQFPQAAPAAGNGGGR